MTDPESKAVIGIECGGTRTVALAAAVGARQPLARIESGPANLRLTSDSDLQSHFESLKTRLPEPVAIGIGMGAATTTLGGTGTSIRNSVLPTL